MCLWSSSWCSNRQHTSHDAHCLYFGHHWPVSLNLIYKRQRYIKWCTDSLSSPPSNQRHSHYKCHISIYNGTNQPKKKYSELLKKSIVLHLSNTQASISKVGNTLQSYKSVIDYGMESQSTDLRKDTATSLDNHIQNEIAYTQLILQERILPINKFCQIQFTAMYSVTDRTVINSRDTKPTQKCEVWHSTNPLNIQHVAYLSCLVKHALYWNVLKSLN
jgi:hypothetical protein